MNSDSDAVPRTFNQDLRHRSQGQLLLHKAPNAQIGMEELRKFLAGSIPTGSPVFIEREPETNGVNFLPHKINLCFSSASSPPCVSVFPRALGAPLLMPRAADGFCRLNFGASVDSAEATSPTSSADFLRPSDPISSDRIIRMWLVRLRSGLALPLARARNRL